MKIFMKILQYYLYSLFFLNVTGIINFCLNFINYYMKKKKFKQILMNIIFFFSKIKDSISNNKLNFQEIYKIRIVMQVVRQIIVQFLIQIKIAQNVKIHLIF